MHLSAVQPAPLPCGSATAADRAAVIVLVGPAPEDVGRLADFADALAHHEPGSELVLVDDAAPARRRHGAPRDLVGACGPSADRLRVSVVPHPGHAPEEGWSSGNAMGLLTGLGWIARHSAASLALKLDTDSLVIAPFRTRLLDRLAEHPRAGLLGCCRVDCEGGQRDSRHWRRRMIRLTRPVWIRSKPCPLHRRAVPALAGGPARVRRVLAEAVANGYCMGDNVMGGGFAMTRALIDAMHAAGDLEPEAVRSWHRTYLCDDVMIGPACSARGFEMLEDAEGPGVFGVAWKGLPRPLTELEGAGYAIVHAVKNDPAHSEDQIRDHFRARRIATHGATG